VSTWNMAQIEKLEASGAIQGAELVITREEAGPMLTWLEGSDDGDFSRGTGIAIDLMRRIKSFFGAEPAAESCTFTKMSLSEEIGWAAAVELFGDLVAVKGELIARRIREERENGTYDVIAL
jgi:hypothetical protein